MDTTSIHGNLLHSSLHSKLVAFTQEEGEAIQRWVTLSTVTLKEAVFLQLCSARVLTNIYFRKENVCTGRPNGGAG